MGFLKNVVADNGLEAPNAYHRIDSLSGNQEVVNFTITAYPSFAFYQNNKLIQPLTSKQYSFKPDVNDNAPNFFRQAYAHSKELDDYQDTIDVLEEGQAPLE